MNVDTVVWHHHTLTEWLWGSLKKVQEGGRVKSSQSHGQLFYLIENHNRFMLSQQMKCDDFSFF
jgi:hypothetical protein